MKITDWWIPLALAGAAGGANFYVLNQATAKKPGVRVMVAAKDLPAGSTLTANDLTAVRLQVDGEANSLKPSRATTDGTVNAYDLTIDIDERATGIARVDCCIGL